MNTESIAGLAGLAIAMLVLLSLLIFEWSEYKRSHHGENAIRHWLDHHHLFKRRSEH